MAQFSKIGFRYLILIGATIILSWFWINETTPERSRALKIQRTQKFAEAIQAGFSLDTSGNLPCYFFCPKVGLKTWARFQNVQLEQIIRYCDYAGFGDPFIDGAECDGESIKLKVKGKKLLILSNSKQEMFYDFSEDEQSEKNNGPQITNN